jgi:hypothetical protein
LKASREIEEELFLADLAFAGFSHRTAEAQDDPVRVFSLFRAPLAPNDLVPSESPEITVLILPGQASSLEHRLIQRDIAQGLTLVGEVELLFLFLALFFRHDVPL